MEDKVYGIVDSVETLEAKIAQVRAAEKIFANFTQEQVDKMRELYASGMTKMEVVKYFYPDLNFKERKKKYSRIKDILDYKTWQ